MKVTFVVDGEDRTTELEAGESLLKGIYKLELDETWGMGECGGNCACSTCHVYVRQGDEYFNEPSVEEENLLDTVFTAMPESRLACQLKVQTEHEHIVLEVPSV